MFSPYGEQQDIEMPYRGRDADNLGQLTGSDSDLTMHGHFAGDSSCLSDERVSDCMLQGDTRLNQDAGSGMSINLNNDCTTKWKLRDVGVTLDDDNVRLRCCE